MSKLLTIAKPRPGDWQGLIVALSDIERDVNRALPYGFVQASLTDNYLIRRSGTKLVSSILTQGTGAPGAGLGSDGDFYFRTDGGALTTIYQKRAGAWVGIV